MLGVSATKLVSTPVARFLFFSAQAQKHLRFPLEPPSSFGEDERVHFESMAKEHEEQKANLEEPNLNAMLLLRTLVALVWGILGDVFTSLRSSQKPIEFTHSLSIRSRCYSFQRDFFLNSMSGTVGGRCW